MSGQQASLQRAYCLYTRSYRESSLLVHLLTKEDGKLVVLAKGVKGARAARSAYPALLQPFHEIHASWVGKSSLKTLTNVEAHSQRLQLKEKALLAGMYLNELLVILLPEGFEYPQLYRAYTGALVGLAEIDHVDQVLSIQAIEQVLRAFEKVLLEEIGYGIAFHEVTDTGEYCAEFDLSSYYQFQSNLGFMRVELIDQEAGAESNIFSGECLIKMANDDYKQSETLLTAKKIMRQAIEPLLGDKVLNSRQLFL